MDMCRMDHGDYPPVGRWYIALDEHMGVVEEGVDPFKCQIDHSADPTSYFCVPRSVLPWHQRGAPLIDIPMLVGELYHPTKTTVPWCDGHQTAVDKID